MVAGLVWMLAASAMIAALPAFPGAEGGGAGARGGRGGAVVEVTNLDDSGPGSLRAACEKAGPRIVVFRTSGVITLTRAIEIKEPFITIAGQTAPGAGITLRGQDTGKHNAIDIRTHDVVIRFLRLRGGEDCIDIVDQSANVIIDHCSVSWARDENMYVGQPANHVTVSWILNAECLMPHSCGILIHGSGWDPKNSPRMEQVDVHHNFFLHNMNRNPKIKAMSVQSVNNIAYDWSWWGAAFAGGVEVDFVGNLFKRGPSFLGEDVEKCCGFFVSPAEILWRSDYTTGPPGRDPSVYMRDNASVARPHVHADNWSMIEEVNPGWVRTKHAPARRFERQQMQAREHPITIHPVDKLEAALIADVGASRRLDENGRWVPNRDAVDERLLREYRSGTGKLIASVAEVGGFPTVPSSAPYADTDRDGMPDAWEKTRGLNPSVNDSAGDRDGDGYTNVEEFLNTPFSPAAGDRARGR